MVYFVSLHMNTGPNSKVKLIWLAKITEHFDAKEIC